MYKYSFDEETGGVLLLPEHSHFSKEPRPVYYREMDLLGFDKYFDYEKNDDAPILWAESTVYYYRGKNIAKTVGGSCYTKPELFVTDEGKNVKTLFSVDVAKMVKKNEEMLEAISQETMRRLYNTYLKYKDKVDVFYVAFSGGKDSIVTLDIVQKTLPHTAFKVLFADTGMEFPDTYETVKKVKTYCESENIEFFTARSHFTPDESWHLFGPPASVNRWCCSVHKTAPQILLLREKMGKPNFTGFAFTGVRADESLSRSKYDYVSRGEKHSGQWSCHTILDWNSCELYLYIYAKKLYMNEAYKKGCSRVGCLVCPNSKGKHEFIKHTLYKNEVDKFLGYIAETSAKTDFTPDEMKKFIDLSYWVSRRSGRELNFGQDKFEIKFIKQNVIINVYVKKLNWLNWAKTIGNIVCISESQFNIEFGEKLYEIFVENNSDKTVFKLTNYSSTREDLSFISLFRSVIIKSIYCVACGVCEVECKFNCIDMKNGIVINSNCTHCYKCHEVINHCKRYDSIRNKISEKNEMVGLDRYNCFGTREEWLNIFIKHNGEPSFWKSEGDGKVANKRKDVFLAFLKDANIVEYNKNADGDKWTKCLPTAFGKKIFELKDKPEILWSLILCNLVYTPEFHWFIENLIMNETYTTESITMLLSEVMQSDIKGHGKRNIIDALRIFLYYTPLGKNKIFATLDADVKKSASGDEKIYLKSITRTPYENAEPRVVLYSLYKFAEHCGDYKHFTLSRLYNDSIESEGISPKKIFGISKDEIKKILTGLSFNYPAFINAAFNMDLDSIDLREEKTSTDVLELF